MSKALEFYLLTDLHHYAPSLGTSGAAFERLDRREQKCLAETGPIIDAYFDKLIKDKKINIILIAGDVSNNGAMESHLDLVPKLKRLKDAGKRVFVITATHDYFVEGIETGKAYKCIDDKVIPATPTDREQLVELYGEFGMDEAIAYHKPSHSYCVKLQDGYRLLCLNDDGDRVFCGYDADELDWILDQIKQAREAGDYIFAMTHHPTLPPFPLYPVISPHDMLGDWEKTTTLLADAGIELMFTGHTHMQNIAYKKTEKGNEYYDVNTSSLVGYPSCMRRVKISPEKIEIHTETIDSFDWDMKGMTVEEYTKNHFSYMINDILDAAANDIDRLADLAPSFSMKPETVYSFRKPIHFIGKGLDRWTLGKVGRVLGVSGSVEKQVKDILLKDMVLEIIQNVYRGNEPYGPGTAEYKAMSAILGSIQKKLSHFKGAKDAVGLIEKVKESMYNKYPDDYEFTIKKRK